MTAITITNAGRNMVRDSLKGGTNPKITYVALGSSSTTPTASDTRLGNEIFRKAVTSYVNGTTGEIIVNMYLSPADAIGENIQEVGFFGGTSATSKPNNGTLLAHGLFNHSNKTNTESFQFQIDFQIS